MNNLQIANFCSILRGKGDMVRRVVKSKKFRKGIHASSLMTTHSVLPKCIKAPHVRRKSKFEIHETKMKNEFCQNSFLNQSASPDLNVATSNNSSISGGLCGRVIENGSAGKDTHFVFQDRGADLLLDKE